MASPTVHRRPFWNESLERSRLWFRSRQVSLLRRFAAVIALLATWEAVAFLGNSGQTSAPHLIGAQTREWILDGTIARHTVVTVQAMLLGLFFGTLAGLILGLLLGANRFIMRISDPLFTVMYAMPKVALGPLFVLWLGIGLAQKAALASVLVFFFIFFNVRRGVAETDEELLNVTRIMGAGRLGLFTKITIPSTVFWLLIGLRMAVPYALIGAVAGELIASRAGLGFLIRERSDFWDITGVMSALLVLGVLALMLKVAMDAGERRMEHFRLN